MRIIYFLLFILALQSCKKEKAGKDEPAKEDSLYFPPTGSGEWATTSSVELKWNSSTINDLYEFLDQNGTRAFIVLYKGKIVLEKYWGKNTLGNAQFDKNSIWYWASAGKTLTAFLVGLAQQQGILDINHKSSDYLGNHWTSLPQEKEDLILVRHQLTMTTGLDYTVPNSDFVTPDCLQYKADAGKQWYYHNAPYTLLASVVSNASGKTYNEFTDLQVESKTGMNGSWIQTGGNMVYWSTPRDAVRFGLLLLNKGKWADNKIMTDTNYFHAMTNSSQTLNPSYGYLTWLNGKSSIILPGLPNSFHTSLSPDAPSDLFAAMGKNGQYIDVIPGKDMVVVRMGEAPDNSPVPTVFHNDMWKKINAVIEP